MLCETVPVTAHPFPVLQTYRKYILTALPPNRRYCGYCGNFHLTGICHALRSTRFLELAARTNFHPNPFFLNKFRWSLCIFPALRLKARNLFLGALWSAVPRDTSPVRPATPLRSNYEALLGMPFPAWLFTETKLLSVNKHYQVWFTACQNKVPFLAAHAPLPPWKFCATERLLSRCSSLPAYRSCLQTRPAACVMTSLVGQVLPNCSCIRFAVGTRLLGNSGLPF